MSTLQNEFRYFVRLDTFIKLLRMLLANGNFDFGQQMILLRAATRCNLGFDESESNLKPAIHQPLYI